VDVTDQEPIEAAASAVEEVQDDTLTLQSGVVLRLKPISPGLLRRAAAKIPELEVPRVYLDEKQREEENPNDPRYLQALGERSEKQALAQMDVAILYGTTVESIPEGGLNSESDWAQPFIEDEIISEDDLGSPRKRYLNWMLYYALRGSDEARLFARIIALCGLTEAEVAEVMASFRSRGLWGANLPVPSEGDGKDGSDVLAPTSRTGTGD